MSKHKHYEFILAWAEGKKIQYKHTGTKGQWLDIDDPTWMEDVEYRVKPEPKPDVVKEVYMDNSIWSWEREPNLRLTFDGETGKLKQAEVIG